MVVAMESDEDYYYSGGDSDMGEFIAGGDDGVDDDADYGYAIDDDSIIRSENNYTVLTESDIQQRQEENISQVSAVLSISRVAAIILLCHYKWNISQLLDEWLADEDRVRRTVGLLTRPVIRFPNAKELTCGICFEVYPIDQIHSADCGHPYCTTCWKGYVTTSINGGPGCLLLRCPDPSCRASVGQDMIWKLASDEDKEKYSRYLIRSYIEDKKKTKCCPASGCDIAVEFELGTDIYDVTCLCSHALCWNCGKEPHRPVDCSTADNWIFAMLPWENGAVSENMNWLCLGEWSDHGERTGGFYACNRYEAAKQEGVYDEFERREMAKNSLERHTHYYEGWARNQMLRQKAIADLQKMQTVHLQKLSDRLKEPESQLKFITEAWQQIIECRRVLKWTYAYGYYLPEHEHAKRQLFEHMQGVAESNLEMLRKRVGKDLVYNFLYYDEPQEDFNTFRPKLAELTRVTRSYFENLVSALENNLSDVKTQAAARDVDDLDHWNCDRCTYANPETATSCQMCHNE